MKTLCAVGAAAAVGLLAALPASAQTLTHRYSFSDATGSTIAADSVGGANGTVNNNVAFSGGIATFGGGSSNSNPSYISLPLSTVSTLQDATLEFYTTSFSPGTNNYEGIFSLATPFPDTTNYTVLTANRASGQGIGTGSRINNGNENQNVVTGTNLTGGQLVTVVYSGFTGVGSTGTETIYVNGVNVAAGPTVYSFADVTAAGATVVGIGGGSPFNDPTYQGSMTEVRLWSGAFTGAQVAADYNAGPDTLGVAAPEPSQVAGIGIGILCLGLLAIKARKRPVVS